MVNLAILGQEERRKEHWLNCSSELQTKSLGKERKRYDGVTRTRPVAQMDTEIRVLEHLSLETQAPSTALTTLGALCGKEWCERSKGCFKRMPITHT